MSFMVYLLISAAYSYNPSNYETRNLCLYVGMWVCPSPISRTVPSIYFTLAGCIAGDHRGCFVKFGAIWTCGTARAIALCAAAGAGI